MNDFNEKAFAVMSHALAISGTIYYLLLLPTPRFWSNWQFWAGFLLFVPFETTISAQHVESGSDRLQVVSFLSDLSTRVSVVLRGYGSH